MNATLDTNTNITIPEQHLLTTPAAAQYLGISEVTLRMQRNQGARDRRMAIVPYVKMGRSIRYRLSDLVDYVNRHLVTV